MATRREALSVLDKFARTTLAAPSPLKYVTDLGATERLGRVKVPLNRRRHSLDPYASTSRSRCESWPFQSHGLLRVAARTLILENVALAQPTEYGIVHAHGGIVKIPLHPRMNRVFNVYCDESCHLEHDGQKVMVQGAVWCPFGQTREIAEGLRKLRSKHRLAANFEIKWGKVSPAKMAFYRDVIDYFLDDDDLHFRAWIIADKTALRHTAFQQDHDTWYYKMMFDLLEPLLSPEGRYRIFLDMKDTRSADKVRKLHEVLCNNLYDFDRKIIEQVQVVRSHEVEQLQLAERARWRTTDHSRVARFQLHCRRCRPG